MELLKRRKLSAVSGNFTFLGNGFDVTNKYKRPDSTSKLATVESISG